MFTLILIYLNLLCTSLASARLQRHDSTFSPEYVLLATAQNASFDCHSRYSILFNGTSPGPPIYMQEGKTTWVRVYNNIPDKNLTVHWHGLTMRTAPFSDGSAQVSQWPIPPNHFFDYEMKAETGDAGTYWYHSHIGFQAVSAFGPLIVKECGAPPYAYDDDITLMTSDYFSKNDTEIEHDLLNDPFIWPGESEALMLNGRSGTAGYHDARDKSCAPYRIIVKPGKTYRMRFIGATGLSLVTLGIEGHDNLTIIEADAKYTMPYSTDHLQIGAGQRFSILFEAKCADELKATGQTDYWVRLENRERSGTLISYALISYDMGDMHTMMFPPSLPDRSPLPSTALPETTYDWLEYALEPLNKTDNAFPETSTRTITIVVQQNGTQAPNGSFISAVNWLQSGSTWQLDYEGGRIPYLIDVYNRGQAAIPDMNDAIANNGWDPESQLFPARYGEVIDIVWLESNNLTGGFEVHPMHAHGGHYWDLGSGEGMYDASANDAKIKRLGYTPVKRDTTMLYRYISNSTENEIDGWRAWRLRVDDAGLWMMHCHILHHIVMGMQTVWVMGDASDITKVPQPYVAGYLEYGGSAYGNASYDPLVNHYFDVDNSTCTA